MSNDAGPPVISANGLTMNYGGRKVLRGVQLTVERGEVLALLGPNGAGKTTMIEVLEGFRRRTGGDVRVLGEDPQEAGEGWRGRIGMVLQSWRDHPNWRVGELLEHFASFHAAPRDPGAVLDELGLTPHRDQNCGKLSGGQRRRLDVALGIIGDPELLFLDEPTTGFDPVVRREFHDMVRRLRDGGMSMVLTTHDLHEAERLADRTAVLIGGRIAAHGTTAELRAMAEASAQVGWTQDGERHIERAEDPSQFVWELHTKLGGPVPDLEVLRPTLEDVYMRMVRAEEKA